MYRLGLDVGVGSLGVALIRMTPEGTYVETLDVVIIGGAVRLFAASDGAEDRRLKRGMRRGVERTARRLDRVSKAMQLAGWVDYDRHSVPKEILDISPIRLRAAATHGRITLPQLARVMRHLADNRGSAAVRESDQQSTEEAKEKAVTKDAIARTRATMAEHGHKTLGQYLYWREKGVKDKNGVRKTLSTRVKPNADGTYDFYPSRRMMEEEFDVIWAEQAQHHDCLTPELKQTLHREIFFQRKITSPRPGRCPYHVEEYRLPKASRLFQIRRIYEQVNNLRFYNKVDQALPYDLGMRDQLVTRLLAGEDLSLTDIKSALGFSRSDHIHAGREDEKAKKIAGYPFDQAFAEFPETLALWPNLSPKDQDAVLHILATEVDDEEAVEALKELLKCSVETAEAFLMVSLPSGYGAMGVTATEKLIDALKVEIISSREAEDRAGLYHAYTADGVVYDRLPYYGEILQGHTVRSSWEERSRYRRPTDIPPHTNPLEEKFGVIPNPVVHGALNQIQDVVNAIIKRYGRPESIHIEVARDLNKSKADREEASKTRDTNTKENDKIRDLLLSKEVNVKPTRDNLHRYKLWKAQGETCIYTGKCISLSDLYGGGVDVDHILPRSRTMDDGLNNKVVCLKAANAGKGALTPFEYFSQDIDKWSAIKRRVQASFPEKMWRFREDAMDKFEQGDGFLDRYRTDNAYIARVTALYLRCLYGEDTKVVAVSSRVVALLRGKWGLSGILGSKKEKKKSRTDNRHHFIDALVTAFVTRSMVQRIQTEAARCEKAQFEKFVETIDPPMGDAVSFYNMVKAATLNKVKISRKADHGTQGAWHEETMLGIVSPEPDAKGRYVTRKRKNISSLKTFAELAKQKIETSVPDLPEVEAARQKIKHLQEGVLKLKEAAEEALTVENTMAQAAGKKGWTNISDKMIYSRAVKMYQEAGGSTKIDLFENRQLVNVRKTPGNGRPYGGYIGGNNHHMDIYQDARGKLKWQCVSVMDMNTPSFVADSAHPGCVSLCHLHKGDVLHMKDPDHPEHKILVDVVKFSEGKLIVSPIQDARSGKERKHYGEKGLKFYIDHQARRVVLDPLGFVSWTFPALTASKP